MEERSFNAVSCSTGTKLVLKQWNTIHFGRAQSRIATLKQLIETLQALPPSPYSLEEEELACKELDELLIREQLLRKLKAKVNWLEKGDANTCFFHIFTITNRMVQSYPQYFLL